MSDINFDCNFGSTAIIDCSQNACSSNVEFDLFTVQKNRSEDDNTQKDDTSYKAHTAQITNKTDTGIIQNLSLFIILY